MKLWDYINKKYEYIKKSRIKTILFWLSIILVLSLLGALLEIIKSTINGSLNNAGISHNVISNLLIGLALVFHFLSVKYYTKKSLFRKLIKLRNGTVIILIVMVIFFSNGNGISDDAIFFRY